MKMNTLADRVIKAIEASGHNASSIARQIGCSPEAVLQWMSGSTKNIKNEFLFALADITKFNARWLATGDLGKLDAVLESAAGQQALEPMARQMLADLAGGLLLLHSAGERKQ